MDISFFKGNNMIILYFENVTFFHAKLGLTFAPG